jgi:hypothetical protein
MFSPSVCSSFSIYHKNKFVAHFIQNLYSLVRNGREISFSDTFHEKIYREKSGVGISTTLLLTLGSRKTHFESLRFSGPLLRTITLSPFFYILTPILSSNHSLLSICRKKVPKKSIELRASAHIFRQSKKDALFSYAILRSFHIIIQYPKCLIAVALIPKIFT